MANKTISGLNSGAPGQASDALPIQRGASNYKLTLSAIAAFVGANGPNIAANSILANLSNTSAPALPATLPAVINDLQPTGVKWYVDQINGNNSNTGTSEFNAFLTVDQAQSAASNGDAIYLNDGFAINTQFSVNKSLIFFSQGVVKFNGGVTIGSVNTRWRGVHSFASTNTPSIIFSGTGEHSFDEINVETTYDGSAAQTIASCIYIPAGASVFLNKISYISLVTSNATASAVTRATHIYTTGSAPFNLVVSDATHYLRRLKNGINYNIYYSDATSVYDVATLGNIKIWESTTQSDTTVNDLFAGGPNYGHNILISDVTYTSQNFRIAGPRIRIANSDSGLFRCAILINNIMIQPAFLENGDILLSNATTSSDICAVTNGTILNSFTLAVSGSGVNIYDYYDSLGNHYSSNAPNKAFKTVYGTSPVANSALTGRVGFNGINLGPNSSITLRVDNPSVTTQTPVTVNSISSVVSGSDITLRAINLYAGYVTFFVQNLGTVAHSGAALIVDYTIHTNYS